MQDKANKILEFMDVVEQLCYVKRFTIMQDGRQENDSDHIMKLCFLALMASSYIKQPHDTKRLLELALVHDLVEADAGDTPLFLQLDNAGRKEEKKRKEMEAIEKYRTILPPPLGENIYGLFLEYEERRTIESRIIHALDVFDGNLQCNKENFGSRYWKLGLRKRIDEMTAHKYGEETGEDIIAALETALVALSNSNREKCRKEGI